MATQVLNFLWLNLDLPALSDPADGIIRQPLPENYIENVRNASARHVDAQIVLWVDSQRLTERQMEYLKTSIEDGQPNAHLQDLRDISEYDQKPIFNKAETNPQWRNDKNSLIWCQVDAAKALVSLQGDFDQTFFADLDHAHLEINSSEVQTMLKKHGLFVGSIDERDVEETDNYGGKPTFSTTEKELREAGVYDEYTRIFPPGVAIENQVWGFERSCRRFFEIAYRQAWMAASLGHNAYFAFTNQVRSLAWGEKIPLNEICLVIGGDGTKAEQPGHKWRKGDNKKASTETVDIRELTCAFKRKDRFRQVRNNKSPSSKTKAGPIL